MTAPRSLGLVTADLVRIATAGPGADTKVRAAEQVRKLAAEAHAAGKAETEVVYRKSLGRAWGAWLDLMMSVSLPSAGGKSLLADVLDHEPELRARFEAAFLRGDRRE